MTTLPLFSTLFRSPVVHLAQAQYSLHLLQALLTDTRQDRSYKTCLIPCFKQLHTQNGRIEIA